MKILSSRFAELRALGSAARARRYLSPALLAAAMLALGSAPSAAGTPAGGTPSTLVVAAAPCHTAPARNNPRKRAAVSESYDVNSLYSTMVLPTTGTAFGAPVLFAQNDGGFSVYVRWSSGDFDGDGDQDLMASWNNGGNTSMAIRRSSGSAFLTSHWSITSVPWSNDTIWVPGNFDGDGDADLAAIVNDGGFASIDVYNSTGSTFSAPQRRMTQGIPWVSSTKWSVGDFNGDGQDDLVSVANGNGVAATVVWLATTSSFSGSLWSNVGGWSDTTSYVGGDFTGDGKADLAGIWDNGGNVAIAVYPSSGSAFYYPSQWLLSTSWFNADDRWVAGKLDDDDKVDLIQAWSNDRVSWRTAWLANSAGTAFGFGFGASAGTGNWKTQASICSGVFNAQ